MEGRQDRPAGHLDVRPLAERQYRRLVGGLLGLWFENGEVTGPVTEITVAGNLIDIYARLIPGSDLEFRGSNNAPSILVDGLAIAGK
jgi:predicted Zn-dependent protease